MEIEHKISLLPMHSGGNEVSVVSINKGFHNIIVHRYGIAKASWAVTVGFNGASISTIIPPEVMRVLRGLPDSPFEYPPYKAFLAYLDTDHNGR